jgi:hypothetical protein
MPAAVTAAAQGPPAPAREPVVPQLGDTTITPAVAGPPTVETPANGNGTGELLPAALPPRRPPARPATRPVRSGAGRPAPAAPLRTRTPSATPRSAVAPPQHHGRRRLGAVMAILAGVAVVVVAAIAITSGGDSSTPAASSSRTTASTPAQTAAKHTRKPAANALPPSKTTVAVLNGTPTPGLATTVANTLAGDGYQRGVVTNASDQQRSVTIVAYTGGHQPEAAAVAKSLSLPSDAVQPIDASTQTTACQGATCPTVVVTVGADRQQR